MTYVHFEISGKSLDLEVLDRSKAPVESAALDAMVLEFDRKLSGLRCPKHGRRPFVRVHGPMFGELDFDVSGCCPKFVAEVRRRL